MSGLEKSTLRSRLSIKCLQTSHKMEFAKTDILSSAGDTARLLILESIFIHEYKPLLNIDSKSDPLYLFNC